MKKTVVIIGVALFILLLAVSTFNGVTEAVFHYRSTSALLKSDKYYYGDLFGLSYLPRFKIKADFATANIDREKCGLPRTINLFVAGDSYLGEHFVKDRTPFCGVKKYRFLRVNLNEVGVVEPVKGETNILLVEAVERDVRSFKNPDYLTAKVRFDDSPVRFPVKQLNSFVKHTFFNDIGRRIEYHLFSYSCFTPVKELKAAFNFRFFKRISGEVFLAPDTSRLLFSPTVDSLSPQSSFAPVGDGEIDSIVSSLNYLHRYYTERGFDEVYFSAIPNPVSVLYPGIGTYNELIPRIQNHPGLRIPIVNIYDRFISTEEEIYFRNDTHWNMNGFTLWLNEFNKKIERHAR
ncbi:MAG: hypothetical protein JXA18_01245 [Chitinispirillaceae bacterium]|nr:hypothetical protein [Chitinispirillaceae bacterium]